MWKIFSAYDFIDFPLLIREKGVSLGLGENQNYDPGINTTTEYYGRT